MSKFQRLFPILISEKNRLKIGLVSLKIELLFELILNNVTSSKIYFYISWRLKVNINLIYWLCLFHYILGDLLFLLLLQFKKRRDFSIPTSCQKNNKMDVGYLVFGHWRMLWRGQNSKRYLQVLYLFWKKIM